MRSCAVCSEPVEEALGVPHKCGHITHAVCIADDAVVDYKKCARCNGTVTDWPEIPEAVEWREPRPTDGVDYIRHPGTKSSPGYVGSALRKVSSLVKTTSAAPPEKTPLDLLNARVPVQTIMKKHGVGLYHMLRDGITIEDFARNNYTWKDLMHFEDIGESAPPERSMEALYSGLRVNANHFRDYPSLLPIAEVKKRTDIESSHLCTHFGLSFPQNIKKNNLVEYESLRCYDDDRWSAKDCSRLGMNIDDLIDIGLRTTQQYEDLLVGCSEKQVRDLEQKLSVTPAHMESLVDLQAIAAQEEEQRQLAEEAAIRAYREAATARQTKAAPTPVVMVATAATMDLTPTRSKFNPPAQQKTYIQRGEEKYARMGFK